MPRKPTGRPRGRQIGSGTLGLGTQDAHTRLTLRIPNDLYTRLEAFAAGRHFFRGSPKLATCVRDAIEHYLTCPTKRQTLNTPGNGQDTTGQTSNSTPTQEEIHGQTLNSTDIHEDTTGQTNNVPSEALEAPERHTKQTAKSTPPVLLDTPALDATPLAPVDTPQPQDRAYDPRTHELGKLCAHGHNFRETGFSVRSLKGTRECRDCVAARQRAAREQKAKREAKAKRQAQPG
jgi:hypothetical protein